MKDLGTLIHHAMEIKPKFGEPCNHCGWCCLTEVCQMGQYHGASSMIPCKYLVKRGDSLMCGLILDSTMKPNDIGIGHGCDAITQLEQLEKLSCNTD